MSINDIYPFGYFIISYDEMPDVGLGVPLKPLLLVFVFPLLLVILIIDAKSMLSQIYDKYGYKFIFILILFSSCTFYILCMFIDNSPI